MSSAESYDAFHPLLGPQIAEVRAQATQLVAQLGADVALAVPLLQAVTTLADYVHAHLALGASDPCGTADDATAPVDASDNGGEALRHAQDHIAQLYEVLREVPVGICIRHGQDQRYLFTNARYDQAVGRTHLVGQTVRAVFPELAGQGINEILDQVYTTGTPFIAPEIMVQLDRRGTGVPDDIYF